MYTDIRTLPNSINHLSNLKSLNNYNCLKTSLPESIGDLKNLTSLIIVFNKLAKLPDSFAQLRLETLKVFEKELKLLLHEITNQIQNTELKLIIERGDEERIIRDYEFFTFFNT